MDRKFRFHVVALPHTQTNKNHNACAYTMKVYNFCKMMHDLGHEVYHYGAEESNPPCTEHIQVISREEQILLMGDFDYKKKFYPIEWDPKLPYWSLPNCRSIIEIKKRMQPRDFLCVIGGGCQKPISDALDQTQIMTVEYGIGYRGVYAKYKVFESYAQMHKIYGMKSGDGDGSFYDCVIPNYYDISEFPFQPQKQDYYLFVGRMIHRKGMNIASETVKEIGGKLILVGQGARQEGDSVIFDGGKLTGPHLEYAGYADVKRRAELMGGARAVFVPTVYIEPFGGVNVEAQLCGTPVITTDWGVFNETVEHGVTGYRCRNLEQFTWAARNVHKLDPNIIRERAIRLYSLEKVRTMYDEYFNMLYDLWEKGWYQKRDRQNLDWLAR